MEVWSSPTVNVLSVCSQWHHPHPHLYRFGGPWTRYSRSGNIIHYHLPSTGGAFTHRNGRTARMNASGKAYVILSADEKIPDYLKAKMPEMRLNPDAPLPPPSVWQTLYIGKANVTR